MGNKLKFYDFDIPQYPKSGLFIYSEHPFFKENREGNEPSAFKLIKPIQMDLSCNHDSDRILRTFSDYLLPEIYILNKGRMFNKEGATEWLQEAIDGYKLKNNNALSFNDYIKRELLKFFLDAYGSDKTRFFLDDEKTDGLIVDLRETLGMLNFKPRIIGHGFMDTEVMYKLMKDILVQFCKIDSFEVAQIQYGVRGKKKIQKTITTACNNPYERFFEYYLHGYRIDILPQLKLINGVYCFHEPISRYTGREPEYREIIKKITGIDPELYVVRPRTEIQSNEEKKSDEEKQLNEKTQSNELVK